MSREALVEQLNKWLRGPGDENGSLGAITDIKKGKEMDVGIFILGACFIDAMASFRYGVTKKMLDDERKLGNKALIVKYPGYKSSSERFKSFVMEYLPKEYRSEDGNDFYKSLRCGLVHTYVAYGKYIFISSHNKKDHHIVMPGGNIQIRRDSFVEELEKAYLQLINDILNKDEVFNNASARLESLGLMKI